MALPVIAVFDIGKTNKKFFLFDKNLQEIKEEYIKIPQIKDEDGDECEDLHALSQWVLENVRTVAASREYTLLGVNFSTYGASLVHLDGRGQPVSPLYNYLKPFPEELQDEFYAKYPETEINLATASPTLGMLNSGLQLYWLKKRKPETFRQIRHSLHLPQYVSFLISGEAVSEPTSIGCHTKLWDFTKQDYHEWVQKEGIASLLPAIVPTDSRFTREIGGHPVKVGVGIHDSSAALASYLFRIREPFLLISTGTWSISLNPFSEENLSFSDLENDCLSYLSVQGKMVRASRFLLGYELDHQLAILNKIFNKPESYYKTVVPDENIMDAIVGGELENSFYPARVAGTPVVRGLFPEDNWKPESCANYEEAYHQMIWGLVRIQVAFLELARGNSPAKKVYVDGGFIHNQVFIRLLRHFLKGYQVETADFPLGSAYGAALMLGDFTDE